MGKRFISLMGLASMVIGMMPFSVAAQKETYDLIAYIPPKNWKKEVKETLIVYSKINNKKRTWCQVSIVKSTTSKGNIENDFESEWKELVVKNFKPTDTAQLLDVQESEGWKMRTGSAKFRFNDADATAMITTISGFDRCMSIVVATNSLDYVAEVEALFASVDLLRPKQADKPPLNIIGSWSSTASDNSSNRMNNAVMSYIKRQYSFHEDGTYTFLSRAYDPLIENIILGRETGTYKLNGNTLNVHPKESVLEVWSRKGAADVLGKKINSEEQIPEPKMYKVNHHYFSGIDQWQLVFQADEETRRDGPFSSNDSISNAWFLRPVSNNNPAIEYPGEKKLPVEKLESEPVKATGGHQFTFTTTSFDDGWTSTVQEDWVQVTKGAIRVLIHYPNKAADEYNTSLLDGLKIAWDILVAPRYNSLEGLEFKPVSSWESLEFAETYALDKLTGQKVYVVLFKKNYSNGSGKYLEFITKDKAAFEQEFGVYQKDMYTWEKLENLAYYNRFAIATADLPGKWTNNFSGSLQYVNVNTGLSAGATSHASSQTFQFQKGNQYNWNLGVASGVVGNLKFQSVKSNGKFSVVGNWQISFSDIEGKPRVMNAHFSCIKGHRLLWIDGDAYGKVE